MPLLDYEMIKRGSRSRFVDQTVPRSVRERWLLAAGHSSHELAAAEGRARRIRMRRIRSAQTFESDGLELLFSNVQTSNRPAPMTSPNNGIS